MNSRKQNNSRRHPLVRFFRSVYRLLKVLFKTKPNKLRATDYPNDRSSNLEPLISPTQSNNQTERLITLGELFEQIKWQLPPAIVEDKILEIGQDPRIHDVSRN
jgi:hypothetical protein